MRAFRTMNLLVKGVRSRRKFRENPATPWHPLSSTKEHEVARESYLTEKEVFSQAFSMSISSPAYPPAPDKFFDRPAVTVRYRTDPDLLRAIVPAPLVVKESLVSIVFLFMIAPGPAASADWRMTRCQVRARSHSSALRRQPLGCPCSTCLQFSSPRSALRVVRTVRWQLSLAVENVSVTKDREF
jgi:hypothetical protein